MPLSICPGLSLISTLSRSTIFPLLSKIFNFKVIYDIGYPITDIPDFSFFRRNIFSFLDYLAIKTFDLILLESTQQSSIYNNQNISKNPALIFGTPKILVDKKLNILSLLSGGAAKENFSHWFLDVIPKIFLFKKLFNKEKIDKLYGKLYGSFIVYITLVWLAYWVLLSSGDSYSGFDGITNIVQHYFTPIVMIIDWLYTEKKRYEWNYYYIWSIYPTLYAISALLNGYLGLEYGYLYGFLDPSNPGGWLITWSYVVGVYIFYTILAFSFIGINRKFLTNWLKYSIFIYGKLANYISNYHCWFINSNANLLFLSKKD